MLTDLSARIKTLDTQAAAFAKLVSARDEAQATWRAAQDALDAANRRRIELEALRAGQRVGAHLQRLDAQLAGGFGVLPDPPEDWLRDAEALDRAETELHARLTAAQAAVSGLRDDLEKIAVDEDILALTDAISAAEALKPGHDTALTDLPRRAREREGDAARRADCLTRLGRPPGSDATALLPEASVLGGRLRGLVEAHGAIHGGPIRPRRMSWPAPSCARIRPPRILRKRAVPLPIPASCAGWWPVCGRMIRAGGPRTARRRPLTGLRPGCRRRWTR